MDGCEYRAKLPGVLKKHVLLKHTAAADIRWFEYSNCRFAITGARQQGVLTTHGLLKHRAAEDRRWLK